MTVAEILNKYDIEGLWFNTFAYGTKYRTCTEEEQKTVEFKAEAILFQTQIRTEYMLPDKALVTPKIVQYWENRISECKNALFKARYSGLVWEFKEEILSEKPDRSIVNTHIESLITVLNDNLCEDKLEMVAIAKRAITLSLMRNHEKFLGDSKKALNSICANIPNDDECLYIYCLPLQLLIKNGKLYSQEETKEIVESLEARFEYAVTNKKDPYFLFDFAKELSKYYKREQSKSKIQEIFEKVVLAYESQEYSDNTYLLLSDAFHKIAKLLSKYGLTDAALALRTKNKEISKYAVGEMKVVSSEITMPTGFLDNWLNYLLEDDSLFFDRFIREFVPRRDDLCKQLKDEANSFLNCCLTIRYDRNNRIMEDIGSFEENPEKNIVLAAAQSIRSNAILIKIIVDKAKKKGLITYDSILGRIKNSTLFTEHKMPFVERGLKAYFGDDHMVAMHLLIPQIEAAVREFCSQAGFQTLKKRVRTGNNHYQLQTLDSLLRTPEAENKLIEDMFLYLRVLLTDECGLNLRNDLLHGIMNASVINEHVSNIILHALLIVAGLAPNEK